MIVRVHRAICGERDRAHSLLATSTSDEAAMRFLPLITDLPLNQPAGFVWEPFIRGFAREKWYVLTKTFSDQAAPRPGMVRTYALLLALDEAIAITDLSEMLALLPAEADENWVVVTSEVELVPTGETLPFEPPGFASLIHELIRTSAKTPVVWQGQAGFSAAIIALWRTLWPSARRQFSFGLHFTPDDLKNAPLQVIAIPEQLANRWPNHLFVRMDGQPPTAPTTAESFLRGLPAGDPIRHLLQKIGTDLFQVADLPKAEVCADLVERLPTLVSGELRTLLHFLVQLAPKTDQGALTKADVLQRLFAASTRGSADDILALRGFYGLAVSDIDNQASQVATQWLQISMPEETRVSDTRQVTSEALRTPQLPWSKAVIAAIKEIFVKPRLEVARTLWAWWQAAPTLVERLAPLIPASEAMQTSLVATCPPDIMSVLAPLLRSLAAQKGWFSLHAVLCVKSLPPDEAIEVHLAVDQRAIETEGVRLLTERLPAEATVAAALLYDDERILRAAARLCSAKPEHLLPQQVIDPKWRRLLAEALTITPGVWTSLNQTRVLADGLLDVLLAGQTVESKIFEVISTTPEADLSGHVNRPKIWAILPAQTQRDFLEATASGWIAHFQAVPGFETSLERELVAVVLSSSGKVRLLDPRCPNAAAVGLSSFTHFRQLDEPAFCDWIRNLAGARTGVPREIADWIGNLVVERQWRRAADALADATTYSSDLVPAARQCLHLLGLIKGFFARRRLGETELPLDDFWKIFEEVAIELYKRGPTDRSLWDRAKGKDSKLSLDKSGAEQWFDAIHLLRHGGGGKNLTVHSLLATMIEDYEKNPTLRELEQTARQMKF